MPSASFVTRCQNKTAEPTLLFEYELTLGALDYADYSSYVKSISSITRTSELTAGYVDVELNNAGGDFDDFLDDSMALDHAVMISLYFADIAESLAIFTGYVEAASMGLKSVKLRIRDRLNRCLAKTVGSGESPVLYDPTIMTVPEIVWDLLTTYAKLDSTHSTDNVDIDYTSFLLWEADMDSVGNAYALKTYLTGPTVSDVLNRIADLTNSIFWGNGEGRIEFASAVVYTVGTVPVTKEYVLARTYDSDLNGMVNDIRCYYNLDMGVDIVLTDTSISFHDNSPAADTIEDFNNQFITSGFTAPMEVEVFDSALNNGIWHIETVAAGALTLYADEPTLRTEEAGASITVEKFGYEASTNEWESSVQESRYYGPSTLAIELTEEDRSIWHHTQASAERFTDEKLDRLSGPIRTFNITTAMLGFLSDIGNVETLTNHYTSPNHSIDIHIQNISYDFENYEVNIKGQWLWDMA